MRIKLLKPHQFVANFFKKVYLFKRTEFEVNCGKLFSCSFSVNQRPLFENDQLLIRRLLLVAKRFKMH